MPAREYDESTRVFPHILRVEATSQSDQITVTLTREDDRLKPEYIYITPLELETLMASLTEASKARRQYGEAAH